MQRGIKILKLISVIESFFVVAMEGGGGGVLNENFETVPKKFSKYD